MINKRLIGVVIVAPAARLPVFIYFIARCPHDRYPGKGDLCHAYGSVLATNLCLRLLRCGCTKQGSRANLASSSIFSAKGRCGIFISVCGLIVSAPHHRLMRYASIQFFHLLTVSDVGSPPIWGSWWS